MPITGRTPLHTSHARASSAIARRPIAFRAVYETIELERGAARRRSSASNRPEALNAWNATLGEELLDAVRTVAADDGVRAVCVTGAGRAFSSGADLRDMAARGLHRRRARSTSTRR